MISVPKRPVSVHEPYKERLNQIQEKFKSGERSVGKQRPVSVDTGAALKEAGPAFVENKEVKGSYEALKERLERMKLNMGKN